MIYATIQLIVSVLLLGIAATGLGYHLIAGNMGAVGMLVSAIIVVLLWGMVRLSYREFMEEKANK